jgi:hypothetical protein
MSQISGERRRGLIPILTTSVIAVSWPAPNGPASA